MKHTVSLLYFKIAGLDAVVSSGVLNFCMVRDANNLTLSTGVRAFLLLVYVDSQKENDGYSV